MSIAGLIEHLTSFASELRSSNSHLYYPHKAFAKLDMQYSFPPTDAMRSQARKWMERLIQRPGIACVAVRVLPREGGGSVVVMSSDAAKDGTPTPGVGGHMHGMSWYLPLSPEDVAALPINWLEFLGIYGNFVMSSGRASRWCILACSLSPIRSRRRSCSPSTRPSQRACK